MKNIIRRISVFLGVAFLLVQSVAHVAAANEKIIRSYDNTTGKYYGVDINQNQYLNKLESGESKISNQLKYEAPLFNIDENNVEEEEEFIFLEAVDEYASIYQSTTDPNLKRLVLSQIAVNYEKDGNYYPIDTTIRVQDNSGIMLFSIVDPIYENVSNNFSSYFGSSISSAGVEYENNGVSIKLKPQVTEVEEPVIADNTISYRLAADSYLKYIVSSGAVSEEYVLVSPGAGNSISYEVELTNATLSVSGNNITVYRAGSNVPIFFIPRPLIRDSEGREVVVDVTYSGNILTYTFEADILTSGVYPLTLSSGISSEINSIWTYAHLGHDISVAQNFSTYTISDVKNEDLEYWGWYLPASYHYEGYLYLGNNPTVYSGQRFGDSYTLYKLRESTFDVYGINNKYIKRAILTLPIKNSSGDNTVYSCTIDVSYPFESAIYNNINTALNGSRCSSANKIKDGASSAAINITDYVKGKVEKGKANNGVVLLLDEAENNYLTFHAHEYYYIDKYSGAFPSVIIDYYDNPDVDDNMDLNDFDFKLRPFSKYNYLEGLAYFTLFRIDGVAPLNSEISVEIKDSNDTVVASGSSAVIENFFIFPDYPEIVDTQSYDIEESNYQLSEWFGNSSSSEQDVFKYNEVYRVYVTASKDGSEVSKETWFQIYEVKSFDVLSSIATFYGVPVETLIRDNNLQDELVVEGNVLFIREPSRNGGEEYETPELSEDLMRQIDAALQGRGLECEFGFEPINFNTGNFLFETKDSNIKVYGEDAIFGRTYNSTNSDYLSIFGYGWSHSGDYRVVYNGDKSTVLVYLASGKQYVFNKEGDSYLNNLNAEIKLTVENGLFVYSDNAITVRFNKMGTVSETESQDKEITKYYYLNSLLSSIELPNGKKYILNYNRDNLVSSVTLPDNNKILYSYDEYQNLVSFTDQQQTTVRYEYDGKHNMTAWYNRDGDLVVKNTYDENKRVIKQEDGLGNVFYLGYQSESTIITDGEGNTETITFDSNKQTTGHYYNGEVGKLKEFEKGLLVKEVLENGIIYEHNYNDEAYLLETKKTAGNSVHITTYSYDSAYNLLKWENNYGQSESYTYDSNNKLLSVTDSLGNTSYYQYNGQGLKSKEIDATGVTTSYEYNNNGEVIKITAASGAYQSYTYNDYGFISSVTDHRGNTTTYQHSARNELVKAEYSDGSFEAYEYDANGNQTSVQDRSGNISHSEYNLYGNLIKSTDARGNAVEYEYDGNQRQIKVIAANGLVSETVYDERGRTYQSLVNGIVTSTTYYNEYGVEKVINQRGQTMSYLYDAAGNIVETKNYDGTKTYSEYDDSNRVVKSTDIYGHDTYYEYDLNNQLLKTTDDFSVKVNEYDESGRLLKETVSSVDSTRVAESIYNDKGQLIEEIDAYGKSVKYIYDLERIVATVDELGIEIKYEYDRSGNISKEIFADGSIHSFEYDYAGNKIKDIDSRGYLTEYKYDANYNMSSKTYHLDEGEAVYTFKYDKMNNMIEEVTPHGSRTEYSYDLHNNLSSKSVNGLLVAEFFYDEYNQLLKEVVNGVSTVYEYDVYGNRIKDIHQSTYIKEYIYDNYRQITEIKVNGVSWEKYDYDEYGRVESAYNQAGLIKAYVYNSDNNIIRVTDFNGMVIDYEYEIERIIKEEDSFGNIKEYEYDAKGQVVEEIINGAKRYMAYDIYGNVSSYTDSLGNYSEYSYDSLGNLVYARDASGRETAQFYNGRNLLSKLMINGVVIKETVYDLEGRVIGEYDGERNYRQKKYNDFGLLVLEVDAVGNESKYTYDNHFNLVSVENALGQKVTYEYNELNQQSAVIDARGNKTSFSYDVFGNVVEEKNARGASTTSLYNEYNQLVEQKEPSGLLTSFKYNDLGNITIVRQDGLVVSETIYNQYGQLIEEKNALGHSTKFEYDKEDRLLKETDALGFSKEFEYDSESRVVAEINENGYRSEYSYDELGQLLKTISEDGAETVNEYDGFGNVIRTVDPGGIVMTFAYDKNSRLISITDTDNNVSTIEYDGVGNVIKETDALGHSTSYVYDEVYNKIQEVSAEGGVSTYLYDANRNLEFVQTPSGNWINYQYDEVNNLIKESQGSSSITTSYDLSGNVIKVSYPYNFSESFTYDKQANLLTHTQKDKSVIKYEYNELNQLIKKNDITYSYDELGRMNSYTDKLGKTTISYDGVGNVIEVERNGQSINYGYDLHNNQSRIIYPDGSVVENTFNLSGQLTSSINPQGRVDYSYNRLGRLVEETNSSGLKTVYEYDAVGNNTRITSTQAGLTISDITYQYNKENSIIKETKQVLNELTVSEHSYNESDELISSTVTVNGESSTKSYFISPEGNKLEVDNLSGTYKKSEYNYLNQLVKFDDGTYSYEYVYDSNGNRIKEVRSDGKAKYYEYDEYNQLIKVVEHDGYVILYSYDGLGNRVEQVASKTYTLWESEAKQVREKMRKLQDKLAFLDENDYCIAYFYGEAEELMKLENTYSYYYRNRLIEEERITYPTEATYISYLNDISQEYTEVISEVQDGLVTNYYYGNRRISSDERIYVYDGLGNVIQDISKDGGLLESYSYSAYGERNIQYNPFLRNSSYGYRGEAHTYDNKQYLRARYYDVHSEIFIQEDSYKGELDSPLSRNRYAYVLNNPYKYSDPSGHAVTVSADGGALYSIEYANRQWGLLYSRKNYGKTKGPWEIYSGFYNGKLYKNGGWYTGNYNGYYYSGGIQKYKLSTSGGGKGTDTEPPITINDNGTISSPYIPAVITPTTPALSPTAVNTAANMIIAETAKILNINQIMLRQFLTASLSEQELQLSKGRLSDRVIGLCLQFQENYYSNSSNTGTNVIEENSAAIKSMQEKAESDLRWLRKKYLESTIVYKLFPFIGIGNLLYGFKQDDRGEIPGYTYMEFPVAHLPTEFLSISTVYGSGYIANEGLEWMGFATNSNLIAIGEASYKIGQSLGWTYYTAGMMASFERVKDLGTIRYVKNLDDDIIYVAPDGTAATSLDELDEYFKKLYELEKVTGDLNDGLGTYSGQKGHHPISKSAFDGVDGYDSNAELTISQAKLDEFGVKHSTITGQQHSLYSEFAKTGQSLTMDMMKTIEIQSMVNSGVPLDYATHAVNAAIQSLINKGITVPMHIPWN